MVTARTTTLQLAGSPRSPTSGSSFLVAVNALLRKRLRLPA